MPVVSFRVTNQELNDLRRRRHEAGYRTASAFVRTLVGLNAVPTTPDGMEEEFAEFDTAEKIAAAIPSIVDKLDTLMKRQLATMTPTQKLNAIGAYPRGSPFRRVAEAPLAQDGFLEVQRPPWPGVLPAGFDRGGLPAPLRETGT